MAWKKLAFSDEVIGIPSGSAQGDILIRDASGWTNLSAGNNGQFLKTQGTSANPVWADVSTADEKVKADSGDSTPGYLDAKVDDTTIKVDTSNHYLQLKSGGITNTHVNASAAIAWTKISKSGSKISDLDAPSYSGNSLKFLRVNSGETAPEWATASTTDEKVKADSGDSTPGYLDAKIDNTTLRLDSSNHWIEIADGGVDTTQLANSSVTTAKININSDLSFNSHKATSLATPTAGGDAATKDYVDSKINGLDWQDSILDKDLTEPPSSPSEGDRYIVASGASGDWSGHDDDIAEYDGSSWDFYTPNEGFACRVEDEDRNYTYNGSSWVTFGSTVDHGNLIGLADDDHTQYILVNGNRAFSGNISFGDNEATSIRIENASSAPTEKKGKLYFNTSDNHLYVGNTVET